MAAADPSDIRKTTRRISLGGLLVALILLFLSVKLVLPTANLALLAATSLAVAIAVIELGFWSGVVTFVAAALLSIAWPGLAASFPFIIVFGPYPLIRSRIDMAFSQIPAILLRLLAGNSLVALAVMVFAWQDLQALTQRYSLFWLVMPVVLQAVILVYDYALGVLIRFYMTRIKR